MQCGFIKSRAPKHINLSDALRARTVYAAWLHCCRRSAAGAPPQCDLLATQPAAPRGRGAGRGYLINLRLRIFATNRLYLLTYLSYLCISVSLLTIPTNSSLRSFESRNVSNKGSASQKLRSC